MVARLAAANWLLVAIGFVTGPIQARALGPTGRGTLAAIMLPITYAPIVLSVGLGTFATREAARRRPLREIAGSSGLLLLLLGGLAAVASPFVASLFAGGRPVVHQWVLVGFLMMPVSLGSLFLLDIATGVEAWTRVLFVRVIPPVLSLVGIVTLACLHALTVANIAILTLAAGLLATVPTLYLLPRMHRPVVRVSHIGEAFRFGSKAWLGGLGSLANLRLDQILMTRLVVPRELGLYVVAVTVSGFFVSPFLSALTNAMIPRFAEGDRLLAGRLLRITLLGVAALGGFVALITPIVLPLFYGHAFSGAVPMAWMLILGSIPLAGVSVLSTVLTVSGHPGFSAVSELLTVCITVPALVVILPRYGGMGAAVVSAIAYGANLTMLVLGARRHLRLSLRQLLVVGRADLGDLRRIVRAAARRVTPRLA